MTDRRTQIIAALEEGRKQTLAYFRALTPSQLKTQIYHDEVTWSARQVLAHLVTIERSMQWLFRNMLAGGPGTPPDFDVDRFNRTQPQKLDGLTFDELSGQFSDVRRETIAIVEAMSDKDLDREGVHAFHGLGTLERFIRWAYEHARLHEADIRRVLKPTSP